MMATQNIDTPLSTNAMGQWARHAQNAVVRVGDGRGFVVDYQGPFGREPVVITAAHCIEDALLANGAPGLPLCDPARAAEDGTYTALLAPLGAKPTVWAACLFVDPIADIAVLGQPDNQALVDEAAAFDALMANTGRLTIADAPAQGRELVTGFGGDRFEHFTPGEGLAWVLSLEGHWCEGRVERRGGCLSFNPKEFFVGGMSGSPIVDATGAAIGVVSVDCMSPVVVDTLSTQLMQSICDESEAEVEAEAVDDAEIEAILEGPPPELPPAPDPTVRDVILPPFDQAVATLADLQTKPLASFVASTHQPHKLKTVGVFLREVADAIEQRKAASDQSGR
jgi:Trypsin-like peptidase domain